jgi:hypothetical protein
MNGGLVCFPAFRLGGAAPGTVFPDYQPGYGQRLFTSWGGP